MTQLTIRNQTKVTNIVFLLFNTNFLALRCQNMTTEAIIDNNQSYKTHFMYNFSVQNNGELGLSIRQRNCYRIRHLD